MVQPLKEIQTSMAGTPGCCRLLCCLVRTKDSNKLGTITITKKYDQGLDLRLDLA